MIPVLAEELSRRRAPRRRARLPSPTALRELSRLPPAELVRLASPARAGRIGRIDDDERLVGLLMIRNENDILPVSLAAMVRYFDRILVLDGTDRGPERERCHQILERYPEVVFVATDDDLANGGPVRDGARQLLLDEARRRFGVDQWIGVLHGDEIHVRDPRPALASLNPILDPCVRIRLAHFFLHPDDEPHEPGPDATFDPGRLRHHMFPGVPETRFFFDTGRRDYQVDLHSKVVPRSLRTGPLLDGLVVAHYNFRSPTQARSRAHQRIDDGWQAAHYLPVAELDRAVTPTLQDPDYDPFDAEHLDPVHGAARSVTTAEAPVAPRLDLPAILIGGTGRSGSTMLKTVLGRHPALRAFPFELKVLSWPGGIVDLAQTPSRRRALRLQARLLDQRASDQPEWRSGPTTNWGFRANAARPPFPGYDDAVRLLCRVLGSPRPTTDQRLTAGREFVGLLVAHLVGDGAVEGWVEQTPANVERPESMLELLPDAHLVHLVRHPADVAASLLSMPWGPTTVDEAIDHISGVHEAWERASGDPRTTTLRLEDLLDRPEASLAPMLDAVGVARWSPVLPPPDREPVGRTALTSAERVAIEQRLADVFDRYGYD